MAASTKDVLKSQEIKPCKRCNKTPLSGVKCTKCSSLNHPGCVKLLKDVIHISENYIICCGSETNEKHLQENLIAGETNVAVDYEKDDDELSFKSTETTITEAGEYTHLKSENLYLKSLLTTKEELIDQLKVNIISLTEQVVLLQHVSNFLSMNNRKHDNAATNTLAENVDAEALTDHEPVKVGKSKIDRRRRMITPATMHSSSPPKSTHETNVNEESQETSSDGSTSTTTQKITKQQMKKAVEHAKMTSLINPNNLQKQERAPQVIGENTEETNLAAKLMIWLFISNYATTYSENDLLSYLQGKFPGKHFVVNSIKNWGTYNSFKVAIEADLKSSILQPALWPQGIKVSEFLFKKSGSPSERNINHSFRPSRTYTRNNIKEYRRKGFQMPRRPPNPRANNGYEEQQPPRAGGRCFQRRTYSGHAGQYL